MVHCTCCTCIHTHLDWLVAIGQNVQQVGRRDEIESWERESLSLQVLCQSLLADGQPVLDALQLIVEVGSVAHLYYVGDLFGCRHQHLHTKTNTTSYTLRYFPHIRSHVITCPFMAISMLSNLIPNPTEP